MKEIYFEGLFTNMIKRFYPCDRYKRKVDVVMVCNNKSLKVFFNKLYSKYKVKHSYNDFMNECTYWTNFAIQRFTIRDNGSWEDIIAGTDKANIGRLITNIKTTIENEIIRFMNDDVKFTSTRNENGKVEHVKYKFNFSSLDAVLMGAEGFETSLIQMVGNDKNFWSNKQGYEDNQFLKWFKENKERILTKSQVQLLENLKKCSHEKDGYTENDINKYVGFNSKKVGEYLERIKVRVLKVWEKEKPLHETQLQKQKDAELELWMPLVDLIYSEEVTGQNKAISDWFIDNLDNEKVSNIVYDHITEEESKSVVHAYVHKGEQTIIPSKILYKLIEKVEERLDYLQQLETESVKFYKKDSEMGRYTLNQHKAYGTDLKGFSQQPCKVYDIEGNFIREDKWKPFKHKATAPHEVLPTGIIISE